MKKLAAVLLAFFLFAFTITPVEAAVQGSNAELQRAVSVTGKVTESVDKGETGNTNINWVVYTVLNTAATITGPCQLTGNGCNNVGDSGSLSSSMTKAFAYLYTPPATTERYIADVMNSAGLNIAKPAYAQGLGFSSLDPILDTWKAFRNVAYLFYVIMFLVIGFMIMFRQKISSQAVVTAQQALPKIIISLIAVTFSYALAGLMIDAMYLIMYLIVGLFPSQTFENGMSLKEIAMDRNIFQIGGFLLTSAGTFDDARYAVQAMIQTALATQLQGLADVLGVIGGITFAVVFSLATIFGIFRLFFELLKTYISIIISIVLSPLALMLGALPGNNAFQAWVKTLVANLAVFPGILLILVLAFMLIGGTYGGSTASRQIVPQAQAQGTFFQGSYNGGFLPPYIPGAGSGNAISIMLGLGVILIMPDLAAQIKKTLGGSGGIFEQFANNFTTNLEKGWKGGELVPGLGFTDTRKAFGLGRVGGLSGQNIARKAAIGGAVLGRMGVGGGLAAAGKGLAGIERATLGKASQKRVEEGGAPYVSILRNRPISVTKGLFGGIKGTARTVGSALGDEQFKKEKKK